MPAEQWGADLRSLLRLCNASTAAYLQDIWLTVAPLKQDMARSKMEASYSRTADSLRFRPPCIPHTAAVMVMALAFHTKDPDGVVDALEILFFPDLPPPWRVGSGPPHAEVVRDLGRRDPDLLWGHNSDDGEA